MHFHQWKRREVVALLGGAAAWPVAARAQQGERARRIGALMPFAAGDPEALLRVAAFEAGLRDLGWVPGGNLYIDYRWVREANTLRTEAADLLGSAPDLIMATSSPATMALRDQTSTTPIVFTQVIDPVGQGFVSSLARPGGNLTGFTNFEFSIGSKWLQTFVEVSSEIRRVAVIFSPVTAPFAELFWQPIQTAAPTFAVDPIRTRVHNAGEIEQAIDTFAREPSGGLLVLPDTTTAKYRDLIISLASRHRLPAVYPFRYFADSGGLASLGNDVADSYRRVAAYVDRVLRGTKPTELPVQQPVKFELVINLKTAKALGLTVPPTLLARADEVIE
jgi:putative ABC transport system substrate-binding protein